MYLIFAVACIAIINYTYSNFGNTIKNACINCLIKYKRVKNKKMNFRYNIVIDYLLFYIKYQIMNVYQYFYVNEKTRTIEISYYNKNTKYTVLLPKIKKRRVISKVFDYNDNDITDEIKHYLGPYADFHSINTTPKMLGYHDGLKIKYNSNQELYFKSEEVIHV